MQDLQGKTVIVAGGTGEVGEGIVQAFLDSGASVVVPSRMEEKVEALRNRLGQPEKLMGIRAVVDSEEGVLAFRNELHGRSIVPDAVVASLGGWWSGPPLTNLRLTDWRQVIDMGLTAHFLFAKALLPALAKRPSSSYTLINGAGGLQPVKGSGPVSVSAAAQLMLKDVLAKETPGVRINTLLLATPVLTRSRPEGPANWITAQQTGQYAVYLASDSASDVRGETIVFEHPWQIDSVSSRG